jgi:hypothetical protein
MSGPSSFSFFAGFATVAMVRMGCRTEKRGVEGGKNLGVLRRARTEACCKPNIQLQCEFAGAAGRLLRKRQRCIDILARQGSI